MLATTGKERAVGVVDMKSDVEKTKASSRVKMESLAGGLSGITARLVVAPLDVLKIRLQIQNEHIAKGGSVNGLMRGFAKVFAEERFYGLWKGTMPSLGLWFLYSSMQFPIYHSLKRACGPDQSFANGSICTFASAATASFAATLVSYPFDIIRTQWIYPGTSLVHRSIPRMITYTYKTEGFAGFYRGLTPALVQVVPSMACSFLIYEWSRSLVLRFRGAKGARKDPKALSSIENFFVGGFAGLASKLIVYPLDTIKKRLQVSRMYQNGVTSADGLYLGVFDCIKKMYIEEGVLSVYRGTLPTVLKSSISAALTFTSYEFFLRMLTERNLSSSS